MKNSGALNGVKILDLSRVLAGPLCTMMFADMGAEVIKLEIPNKGDDTRAFGPFQNEESAYFMNMNRNKKGITLNLKGEGKELFLKLVEQVDILIENYRPGTMEKLGIGYEELKIINPSLVYGCVSGFGHYGPYSERPGYDLIGQAMSGIMSVTGWSEEEPTRIGTAMADVLAGLSLTSGVLAALHYSKQTGIGQKVDVGIMDSGILSLQIITPTYLVGNELPKPTGNRYLSNYPTDSFKAKDGNYVISAANDKLWQKVCETMGQPETAFLPEFDLNWKRVENNKDVKIIIEKWSAGKTVDDVVNQLIENGVPSAPVQNIEQVVNDPQVAAREMFVDVEHPIAGKVKITGNNIKMSETKTEIRTHSPLLGQHNEEIFSKMLGLTVEDLEELKQRKVI
jgi:formyl-CoA transferase